MPIIAEDNGGGKDFKQVPPGCYFAICNMVVDLGIQETTYKGQARSQHQVYLRWEIPDERATWENKEGKEIEGPCNIGKTYTLSLSEKANLRKVLENWRGQAFSDQELRGFDITQVVGKCCQIMVQHNQSGTKIYANITGVMGISRDQKERSRAAKSEIGLLVYSLDDGENNAFEVLPKWVKEKLANRVKPATVKTANAKAPVDDDFDDSIPF